jgi:hypothetical protein
MPKDEFDFDDPMELNGVAIACEEDTTQAMADCFIEEFMRLGYNAKQIFALFRNPHYIGMNLVVQNRGEQFVRERIAEIFARWGRKVEWPNVATDPLAPSRSPSERESQNPSSSNSEPATSGCKSRLDDSESRTLQFLPDLGGAAQAEGARAERTDVPDPQPGETEMKLTDPTGAAIPILNP